MAEVYEFPQIQGLPVVTRWLEREVLTWPDVVTACCRASTGRLRIEWHEGVSGQRKSLKTVSRCLEQFSLQEAYGLNGFSKNGRRRRNEDSRWHTYESGEVRGLLKVDFARGLEAREVKHRLRKFGSNAIPPVIPRSRLEILVSQFRNSPTALLAASAGISFCTGGLLEACVILGVIALNGAVGYWTESQSERALRSLAQIGPKHATVLREGKIFDVPMERIVPGDILILHPGLHVPADARVIDAKGLAVDESILTGESFSVAKDPREIEDVATPVADRLNMVFKGSAVVTGEGRAVVVDTGVRTQAGRIQSLLVDRFTRDTLMNQKFDELNHRLVMFGLMSAGALMGIGWWRKQPFVPLVKTGVSMAVAAVPEGLPTVATWTLSQAIMKLLERGVLVRDLQAIESLGALTTICFDKTGTLTENKMRVAAAALPWKKDVVDLFKKDPPKTQMKRYRSLMACAALCNDAVLKNEKTSGSPTELALLETADTFGISIDKVRRRFARTATEYRSDYRRYMVTTHKCRPGKHHLAGAYRMVKGSPEEVLRLCDLQSAERGERALSESDRARILGDNDKMSGAALRVLGFAYQRPGEKRWIWLGLLGLSDPPRAGVREELAKFHEAGIRTVMITGDQPATAEALADALDIAHGEKIITVDMSQRRKKSAEELKRLASRAHVFARVAPEDKKKIVDLIKETGATVGMVGDGINDSPALKASDVGIAIGKSGTEVAREVAGVVLTKDSLSDLLGAITMSRSTGVALRKPVRYLVSTNLSELAIVTTQMLLGARAVLDPLQILWVNLVTDTLPALALASDPDRKSIAEKAKEVLKRGPLDLKAPFLSREQVTELIKEVTVLSSMVIGSTIYGARKSGDSAHIQTMALDSLAVGQMLHALSCHSSRRVSWNELVTSHRRLFAATMGSAGLHMALTTLPGFNRLFRLARISRKDTAISVAMAVLGFLAIEGGKVAKAAPDRVVRSLKSKRASNARFAPQEADA